MKIAVLIITHLIALALGFGAGVYTLPILTAAPAIEEQVLEEVAQSALYTGDFTRDLRGSDFAHWGEGTISVSPTQISHQGQLSPGPDYKLYLVNQFVEHEDEFLPIKETAVQIADIKGFSGFVVNVPEGVDVEDYNTVLIWCEAFSQFITAVQYKP